MLKAAAMMLMQASAAVDVPFAKEFEYDRTANAHVHQRVLEKRKGATVFDYSYESAKGGRAPAYLVVPRGNGPFAIILYGHWMMPGSPMRSRKEFLEEAVVMARSGAICLLLDSPLVRPGVSQDPDPLHGQGVQAQRQMVVDFRRGLDLLLLRKDADQRRIGYVGHSFDAAVGAQLAAVEKRITSFVLMAGGFANQEYVSDPENPEMIEVRKKNGDDTIHEYFRRYPWGDPVHFAPHSSPAAVFLQYGKEDKPLPERVARRDYAKFGEPKQIAFYAAGHELDGSARLDRAKWLAQRLALKPVDEAALAAIPALK